MAGKRTAGSALVLAATLTLGSVTACGEALNSAATGGGFSKECARVLNLAGDMHSAQNDAWNKAIDISNVTSKSMASARADLKEVNRLTDKANAAKAKYNDAIRACDEASGRMVPAACVDAFSSIRPLTDLYDEALNNSVLIAKAIYDGMLKVLQTVKQGKDLGPWVDRNRQKIDELQRLHASYVKQVEKLQTARNDAYDACNNRS